MPVAVDEGTGATLTLGTSTWETAARLLSLTPDATMRDALETSYLATTTAKTFMPADLRDNGGFSFEFLHIDSIEGPYAAAETVTITYPTGSGQTVPATLSGSAFLVEFTPGAAAVGEIMKGSGKYKWAGTITFTAAS